MISNDTFDAVRQRREEEARKKAEQDKFEDESEQRLIGKDATILGIQALVEYLENKSDGVTIKNHLTEIGTPDVVKVVEKLEEVKECIDKREEVDLEPILETLKQIEIQLSTLPRETPEMPEQKEDVRVTNLSEIDTKSIVDAVNALDLKVDVKAPNVTVKPTDVKVDAPDLEPIKLGLQSVVEAVLGIKWPVIPEIDLKGVESRLDTSNEHLKKLVEKPVGGGGGGGSGTSFKTSTGNLTYVETESDGSIPVTVVAGGGGTSTAVIDPRTGYGISDKEATATYKYFGFEDADGKWYILRKTIATNIFLYAAGASGYTTAWTNRASQSYDTFDNTFSPVTGSVITSAVDIVVKEKSGTATLANVAGSASSVTLLASNTDRRGATIQNDSTAILYVKFGSAASTTSYTIKMAADSYYEIPFGYTGIITGIWSSATGSARITEMES